MGGRKMHYGLIYLILYACLIADFAKGTEEPDLEDDSEEDDTEEDEEKESACPELKEAIDEAVDHFKKLDPFYIGDIKRFKLEDGILRGYRNLKSNIEYCYDSGNFVNLESKLGVLNPELHFHWQRRVIFRIFGRISMKSKEAEFDLKVQLNKAERKVTVADILLTKFEEFQFTVSGLGLFNPLAKGLMHLVFKLFREDIAKLIETYVKEDIERKLNKMKIFNSLG